MSRKLLAIGASLVCLTALTSVESARADHLNSPAHSARMAPRHLNHHRHARILPPEIPYRDPRVSSRPHDRPDFLIHAYLPRPTELPMYNEPPARFPQR